MRCRLVDNDMQIYKVSINQECMVRAENEEDAIRYLIQTVAHYGGYEVKEMDSVEEGTLVNYCYDDEFYEPIDYE